MFSSKNFFAGLMIVATFIAIGCSESTSPLPEDFIIRRVDSGIVVNYSANKNEILKGYKDVTPFIDSLFPVPNEFMEKGKDTLVMALFGSHDNDINTYMDREKVKESMREKGYRPANAYELFYYAKLKKKKKIKSDREIIIIAALGTKKSNINQETNPGAAIFDLDSTRSLTDIYLLGGRDYVLGVAIK